MTAAADPNAGPPAPPQRPPRFDLLDGLRGLAALAVVVYHFTQHNGLHWLSGAWVAVDLFFMLSGFVIAHSYGAKLLAGMPFREFALARLVRLGPLYFTGLLIGLAAALLSLRGGELAGVSPLQLGAATLLGSVWLPYPNHLTWPFGTDRIAGQIYPLNDPAWSLFFEVFVNALFVFYVAHRRRLSSLSIVALASAVFLVTTFVFHQTNPGWGEHNFVFGFPRVVAEFFAGALIFQVALHQRPAQPRLLALVAAAMGVLLFRGGSAGLLNSLVVVPLVVVLATAIRIEAPAWQRACRVLGELSYPLYIVHVPLYRLAWQVPGVRAWSPEMQTAVIGGVCVLAAVALAALDKRARKALTDRLAGARRVAPATLARWS